MTQQAKAKKIVIAIGRTLVKESPKAVCLNVNGKSIWFPRTSVRFSLKDGKLELPYWMAAKNGCLPGSGPTESKPLTPAAQAQQKPAAQAQKPGIARMPLVEEFTKLCAEVRQINQRLAAIQRELSKETYVSDNKAYR